MNKKLKDQYDSLYEAGGIVFGDGEPIAVVKKIPECIGDGTVLDLGGGDGRNALYLAELGFEVVVYDFSSVGLQKLTEEADARGVPIHTREVDVVDEEIEGEFDCVIISSLLHHLAYQDAENLIIDAKQHTTDAGLHIISTFRNQGGLYERSKSAGRFYPDETILKELYKDWEIIEIGMHEEKTLARTKDGVRLKNDVITLIAQK